MRQPLVQVPAPGPQEVPVGGGHPLGDGEPRHRSAERIEAAQVFRDALVGHVGVTLGGHDG
jgi:hypothetical protein